MLLTSRCNEIKIVLAKRQNSSWPHGRKDINLVRLDRKGVKFFLPVPIGLVSVNQLKQTVLGQTVVTCDFLTGAFIQ